MNLSTRNICVKKFILSYIVCTIILALFSLNACKDDPVTVNNPVNVVDTVAMYEWSWDTISGVLLYNIFVLDSNNIFMVGNFNGMMYYNGSTYTTIMYNDPTFGNASITGYNQSNIFISGTVYSTWTCKTMLKDMERCSFYYL